MALLTDKQRLQSRIALFAAATGAFTGAMCVPMTAAAQGGPQNATPRPDSVEVQQHIAAAQSLATGILQTPFEFFCVPGNARPNSFTAPNLVPVQLFDNLYALGNSETVVHVIKTSAGLVLIDSGMPADLETVLLPGLRELGLDPADVKLILLGHGHVDHYGGAAYFQNRYGAQIGTSEADWQTIDAERTSDDVNKPAPDLVIHDREPVIVGDTEILPVAIPGHTPGSLAFIFPVQDAGVSHTAGLFGGTVLAAGYVKTPGLVQYVESIDSYLTVASQMKVDVEIQNHPIFDDTPGRIAALARRQAGQAHPFVIGSDQYQKFWRIVSECMQAEIIRREEAAP